jgi:hypothetical protein
VTIEEACELLGCEPKEIGETIFAELARERAFRIIGRDRRRLVEMTEQRRAQNPGHPSLARAGAVLAFMDEELGNWLSSWPATGKGN